MKNKHLIFLVIPLLIFACDSPVSTEDTNDTTKLQASKIQVETPETPNPDVPAGYTLLNNMEMILYCLPYPKEDFEIDPKLAEARGEYVLVAKDGSGQIKFSGRPIDMDFEELFAIYVKDIKEITKKAPSKQNFDRNNFELAWETKDKLHYLKKWQLPDATETVTAEFEFAPAKASDYAKIIANIIAFTPICE